jgi:hypothetical protein
VFASNKSKWCPDGTQHPCTAAVPHQCRMLADQSFCLAQTKAPLAFQMGPWLTCRGIPIWGLTQTAAQWLGPAAPAAATAGVDAATTCTQRQAQNRITKLLEEALASELYAYTKLAASANSVPEQNKARICSSVWDGLTCQWNFLSGPLSVHQLWSPVGFS